MKKYKTVDEYIKNYPPQVQKLLISLRNTIKKAAPDATETISYGIPTFRQNGNLVHFGAFKDHIGFYPAPSGIKEFKEDIKPYIAGKGTIQFQLDKPIPLSLITKIVKFRINENHKRNSDKV